MYRIRSVQAGLRLVYTLRIARPHAGLKNAYLRSYPSRSFDTPGAKRYVLQNTEVSFNVTTQPSDCARSVCNRMFRET